MLRRVSLIRQRLNDSAATGRDHIRLVQHYVGSDLAELMERLQLRMRTDGSNRQRRLFRVKKAS
jgi:hypothetical protein